MDQVIFTSVRSPSGVGYRIIAASPSVNRKEKAEIIRRAPSHASLDRPDPDAVAMLAFPIAEDRYCVGFSQHAGKEHTARGGERVHTHFVILNMQDYEVFEMNPLTVHAALNAVVGGRPQLTPPPILEQLQLRAAPQSMHVQHCRIAPTCNVEAVLQISLAMLQTQRLLVVDPLDGHDLLDQTITCLPAALRHGLAVSLGLKFSPSRRLQLCIVRPDKAQTRRTVAGQNTRTFDAANPPERKSSRYDAWLDLIKRRWEEGKLTDIKRLATDITEDACPETLANIAALCFDIDAVAKAPPEELARLRTKYADAATAQTHPVRLLHQFHDAAQQRAQELEQPHPA